MQELQAVAALLALALTLVLAAPPSAFAKQSPPELDARAWLLVDARTGEKLAGSATHQMLPIASTTKLMTAYLSLQKLRLSERVTAPPYKPDGAESLLGLEAGEVISVRDLLYALLVASANDGAVTLADAVSGSSERFTRLMNKTAQQLGLRDTAYANPIGLDAPGEGSSAADLVKLVTLLERDPLFRKIVDTEHKTITTDRETRTIETTNGLLVTKPWINGVKTGFTENADYVLVGSGTKKGVKLISVVIGAPSDAARNADTLALMQYGFSLYRVAHPVQRGRTLVAPPVDSGGTVPLAAGQNVELTVRRGEGVETVVDAPTDLEGPIALGQKLGTVSVLVNGQEQASAPVIAEESAPAPNLAQRFEIKFGFSIWYPVAALGLIVIGIAAMLIRRRRAAG